MHECLEQVLVNASEIAAGSSDAEHVHQLRVGIRRLRTAMRELAVWGARSLGPPTAGDELFEGWLSNAMDIVMAPLAPHGP